MNLGPKIFKLLNIKPNQRFKITGLPSRLNLCHPDDVYMIDEKFNIYQSVTPQLLSFCLCPQEEYILPLLLYDEDVTIVPLQEPTPEDKTVFSYFKLLGYKYIAQDEDGDICVFKDKPKKVSGKWDNEHLYDALFCPYPVSCISWKDEEPYYIG